MGKEVQKVNAERKRQRYSKEFKLAAVKLLQSDHVCVPSCVCFMCVSLHV